MTLDVRHAAGVLDVAGVFRTRQSGPSVLPMVAAHSTSSDLLGFLSGITGVGVTEVKRNYTRFGCDEHCAEKHIHVNHSSLRWSVTGVRAGIVLFNIEPFLHLQGDKAREVLTETGDAPFRKPTVEAMAKLGWAIPESMSPPPAG